MVKGMDVSTLIEVEACGGRFYDGIQEEDALRILKKYGTNLIRLRIWNDPFSEEGISYGAGGNDLETSLKLAARAKALGIPWIASIQYSDFWADPGKQRVPKAWRGMDAAALESTVYEYTRSILEEMQSRELLPDYVTIGNEVTNGLLWPYGKPPNFKNIAAFISAGIRAVRETTKAKTVIHLDNGGNNAMYRNWFDNYFAAGGADFDIIGLSYYPFWHGPMTGLKVNLDDLVRRYDKDTLIVETASGFTLEDYKEYEKLPDHLRKGMCATPERAKCIDYPMTPEGQACFMRDLAIVIRNVHEGKCLGFIYWEPAWLPVPGSEWANEGALAFIEEKGPGGNEQANQCLFDYDGKVLPALKAIREL